MAQRFPGTGVRPLTQVVWPRAFSKLPFGRLEKVSAEVRGVSACIHTPQNQGSIRQAGGPLNRDVRIHFVTCGAVFLAARFVGEAFADCLTIRS